MDKIIEKRGTQGEAFEAMTCPTAISEKWLVSMCNFPSPNPPEMGCVSVRQMST
jgi:hypothetical protein